MPSQQMMNLKQLAVNCGVTLERCAREWGGTWAYSTIDAPNCKFCGYRTEAEALKAWLTDTFGAAALALLPILKLPQAAKALQRPHPTHRSTEMTSNPPTVPLNYAPAVTADECILALEQIKHATAPAPDDGGFHEAAYEIADAILRKVEARRRYEAGAPK